MAATRLKKELRRQVAYLRWKLRHPMAPFSDYYVADVSRRLDEGRPHPTLRSVDSPEEGFASNGSAALKFLCRQGLEPCHRCVDYGCGSLRVGRHLIRFLEPGRYVGLDVTDRFFRAGLDRLDEELVRDKRPRLKVITDELLEELGRDPPDYLISIGVLLHVPKRDIRLFISRIMSLIGPASRAFVAFREAERYLRIGNLTWAYPAAMLVRWVEEQGGRAAVLPVVGGGDSAGRATPEGPRARVLAVTREG